jgi:hypothetical protein
MSVISKDVACRQVKEEIVIYRYPASIYSPHWLVGHESILVAMALVYTSNKGVIFLGTCLSSFVFHPTLVQHPLGTGSVLARQACHLLVPTTYLSRLPASSATFIYKGVMFPGTCFPVVSLFLQSTQHPLCTAQFQLVSTTYSGHLLVPIASLTCNPDHLRQMLSHCTRE